MQRSSETFLQLLRSVQDQHEKEISGLMQEISSLQANGLASNEETKPSPAIQYETNGNDFSILSAPPPNAERCPDEPVQLMESTSVCGSGEQSPSQELAAPAVALDIRERQSLETARNQSQDDEDEPKCSRVRRFRLLSFWHTLRKKHINMEHKKSRLFLVPSFEKDEPLMGHSLLASHSSVEAIDNLLFPFVIHPDTKARSAWNIASLVLLCYDMVVLPPYCFIGFDQSLFTVMMEWVTRCFWTVDVPLNFFTGIYSGYRTEFRPSTICISYIRSWFFLDIALVGSDWLLFGSRTYGSGGYFRLFRAFRMSRILRLLRVAKLKDFVQTFLTTAPFMLVGCLKLLKFIGSLGILVHFLTCAWFAVGSLEYGWAASPDINNLHFGLKYVRALHWTFTHVYGTNIYQPRDIAEYSFSIFLDMFGFVAMALFVSRITLTLLEQSNSRRRELEKACRDYLQTRKVSGSLQYRMSKFLLKVKEQTFKQRVAHETEMLLVLPNVIRLDLYQEVRSPLIMQRRFFVEVAKANPRVVRMLCVEAIECVVLEKPERLFDVGVKCTKMYWVESGVLTYQPASDITCSLHTHHLTRGESLCEAALWTPWVHNGELSAEDDCTVLSIGVGNLFRCVTELPFCVHVTIKYACAFVNTLNEVSQGGRPPSDVFCLDIDWDHMSEIPDEDNSVLDEHFMFISHCKHEAGTEATLMQEALERMIRHDTSHPASDFEISCFLDSEDLIDLGGLKQRVTNSHNLVVLLTPQFFTRPWCLVEVITAVRNNVNIVPVEIQRPGPMFQYPAEQYYTDLVGGNMLTSDAVRLLSNEGINLTEVADCVRGVCMKIAVPFSPQKSHSIREAELRDLLERCAFHSEDEDA